MTRLRQKNSVALILLELMEEKGKILSRAEYLDIKPAPMRYATIRRFFGSWDRAINFIAHLEPERFAEVEKKEAPKAPPKVEPALKTKPEVAPKPASADTKKKDAEK